METERKNVFEVLASKYSVKEAKEYEEEIFKAFLIIWNYEGNDKNFTEQGLYEIISNEMLDSLMNTNDPKKVIEEDIKPAHVFENSSRYRKLKQKYNHEKDLKIDPYKNLNIRETDFKCPKCKSKKITYNISQTRSADEAPTTKITCLECRHTYTQH